MKLKQMALALVICLAAAGCAACAPAEEEAKTPAVADVAKTVMESIEFPEMTTQIAEDLQYYGYGDLDVANIEEVYYAIASTGMTPEEILIIKLKDDTQIADLKKMMEARRDAIASTAADYTPELMGEIENAVIETKGNYGYFVISGDSETARKIFDEQF